MSPTTDLLIESTNRRRRLLRTFWIWYALAAGICVAAPEGRIFLGAICLAPVWILVLYFRVPLENWVSRVPGPPWLRFFLVGIVFSDLIMENLAINFKGDLHKHLLVNSFLWLGGYMGWLGGWWLISRRYKFTPHEVFFTAGMTGILVEQNWMIPKLLVSLQFFPVLISVPIIVVVYGAAVAPAFLLAQPGGHPARGFGFAAFSLGVCLPLAFFLTLGKIWIVVFRPFFGLI